MPTASLLLCAIYLQGAEWAAEPLVYLTFERNLANAGSLRGAGRFEDYAHGEEAGFNLGPWGWCLDNTAASRHGGVSASDLAAGSAVAYEDVGLDALRSYTLTSWFRQDPNTQWGLARLFWKPGFLDVLPHRNGVSLGIGEGEAKTVRMVPAATPLPDPGEWVFMALVVDGETVKGQLYVGTLQSAPHAGEPVDITPAPPSEPGPLIIANAFTIRPFKGLVDNVRVYDRALSSDEINGLYQAETRAAEGTPLLARMTFEDADQRRALFRPSDICFSTRWQNEDALPVMRAFHVTRDLWTYGNRKDYVDKVKALGITYQGTLNGMWGAESGLSVPDHGGDTTGRAYDLDGIKYVPSWMRGWKLKVPNFIGCCNHPDFRALFWKGGEELIAAGVDAIHVDDWAMNAYWCRVAGTCFCEHCMAGFSEYLEQHLSTEQLAQAGINNLDTFDYADYVREHDGVQSADEYRRRYQELTLSQQFADFQITSLRRFFRDFSAHIDRVAGRHVPISVNHQFGDGGTEFSHSYCVDLHDFQVGEKFRDDLASHILACKLAEGLGMWQVISPMPRRLGATYAALATTYAFGQLYLVPWDIYMGSQPNGPPLPRFFGAVEQFGPYYDLIHTHPELFDDYKAPAMVGVLVNLDEPRRQETLQVCERLVRLGVPYRVIVGAAKYARIPLREEEMARLPTVVAISPPETFCAEDQAAIAQARATRGVRLLDSNDSSDAVTQPVLRVEGPRNVIAIPRVKTGLPFSAVIHVINWDLTPDGSSVEEYGSVTISLGQRWLWGRIARARLYEPNNVGGTDLVVEKHPESVRITIPRLRVWAIVQIETEQEA